MNTDENEVEGAGSIALASLLLKSNFKFRDQVNTLNYKITQLEKQIQDLKNVRT